MLLSPCNTTGGWACLIAWLLGLNLCAASNPPWTGFRNAACVAAACRLELISRVVTLACLLGEVVLNSLKLFSDATTSSRFAEAGLDNTTFQRDVAFTFVSCGLSIATLIMAAVGFRRVLQAVRSTAQRISTRAGSAASTVRRRASNVGASIVVGIRGSTVQPGRGGTHVVAGPELEADTTPARMERARVAWT